MKGVKKLYVNGFAICIELFFCFKNFHRPQDA